MRNLFNGYYRPSDQQFDEIWKTGTIALDANVLLNLYRYSIDTRDRLISILKEFKSRLWLPHQAALEFHKNRLPVIFEQLDAYEKLESLLKNNKSDLEKKFADFKRHPIIRIDSLASRLEKGFDSALKNLDEHRLKHPQTDEDSILNTITELFDGRVGAPYDDERLAKIYKDGDIRYSKLKPPGYKDAQTKKDDGKFGDLIIWLQMIDYGKQTKSPLILVTDDVKEDWWLRINGKTIGPRPELISEMQKEASVDFYIYKTDQFMEYSNKFIKKSISTAALNEVRDVRRRAIFDALLNKDDYLVSGTAREQLVSGYNRLLEKKLAIEAELKGVDNVIQMGVFEEDSKDMALVIEKATDLRNQLALISAEISSVSKAISIKSDKNNYLSAWELVSDGDHKDIGRTRLAALKALLSKPNC
ncbi:PIN-like domain-containing protein [Azonexus sp.]|uniref:PIN-like domain-containing protein n=1 Tax=Azonexus sp. TaxID=1872668 RepID=UPI0027B970A6|nr:PIN-like domain-containing protein [Azonexus sp.]